MADNTIAIAQRVRVKALFWRCGMSTPSYSLALRLRLPNQPGQLAQVLSALAAAGGNIGQITLLQHDRHVSVREIIVAAATEALANGLIGAVQGLPNVELLEARDRTFALHQGGKLTVQSRVALRGPDDLAMAYTPGVGRISQAIAQDPSKVFELTCKGNTVAVVSDGSAVLGLGNLGPAAALPVMEGKAVLFKEFAGIDAFPICLATQDTEEIIRTVQYLAPVFGGINLEDIAAPRCFEIERRLRETLDIPVFHDDQHGTAIVTTAALLNALRVVHKSLDRIHIVMNGAGAAGIAVANLLRQAGARHITLCDSKGAISRDRPDLTPEKQALAGDRTGSLAEVLVGADVFIGLSIGNVLTPAMVERMGDRPIVFAMANPTPEIAPELVADRVAVMATGRSDYPNQINNVLAFPGMFRGALDARIRQFEPAMYLRAAEAIAALIHDRDLGPQNIVPSAFDDRVAPAVAAAVAHG